MNPVTQLCRQLRNNPTLAEKLLWEEIRRRNIGSQKFLRQYPIFVINGIGRKSFYIADFYCAKHKLVIEVDGPIHLLKKDYDNNRDMVMRELGIPVLRFTNEEVSQNLNEVVSKIEAFILDKSDLLTINNLSKKPSREGWTAQLAAALQSGEIPDDELLEGLNDFDDKTGEW